MMGTTEQEAARDERLRLLCEIIEQYYKGLPELAYYEKGICPTADLFVRRIRVGWLTLDLASLYDLTDRAGMAHAVANYALVMQGLPNDGPAVAARAESVTQEEQDAFLLEAAQPDSVAEAHLRYVNNWINASYLYIFAHLPARIEQSINTLFREGAAANLEATDSLSLPLAKALDMIYKPEVAASRARVNDYAGLPAKPLPPRRIPKVTDHQLQAAFGAVQHGDETAGRMALPAAKIQAIDLANYLGVNVEDVRTAVRRHGGLKKLREGFIE
jgi:hypothetical protein